ncbi:MAG: hypothetical protein ABSF63_09355 [Candidatus Bathyarchaeia archaeon]
MAKLPRKLSGKQLLRVFRKLGFEVVRQRSSYVFLEHTDGDEFADLQYVSEASLRRMWLRKKEDIWNRYLKVNVK